MVDLRQAGGKIVHPELFFLKVLQDPKLKKAILDPVEPEFRHTCMFLFCFIPTFYNFNLVFKKAGQSFPVYGNN